ncbi:hypothetical protein L6252_00205 [Candidatus Parcubacteria bacterium]|nr:hypothetical protein [Candidatus Parcubacteria bacterium]
MEQNNNSKKLAQEWFSRADDDLLFAKAGFKETDIAARYPGGIILNYNKETGAKALKVAEEVINFIQEKVKY